MTQEQEALAIAEAFIKIMDNMRADLAVTSCLTALVAVLRSKMPNASDEKIANMANLVRESVIDGWSSLEGRK